MKVPGEASGLPGGGTFDGWLGGSKPAASRV